MKDMIRIHVPAVTGSATDAKEQVSSKIRHVMYAAEMDFVKNVEELQRDAVTIAEGQKSSPVMSVTELERKSVRDAMEA